MKRGLWTALYFAWLVGIASSSPAQTCPPNDLSVPTKDLPIWNLSGTIRYHSGLRDWLGLAVQPPVCGQRELELTFIQADSSSRYRTTRSLDGCKVKVTGKIDYSPTGYYSTEMFIEDGKIEPDATCHPASVKTDLWKSPIPSDLQSYKATVTLNFADTSKPMRGAVNRTDGRTEALTPWQAYIEPGLNAPKDLLWVSCRAGFHLKDAVTESDGKTARPDEWLNKETLGLSAPERPGPSSITITCVKNK